MEIQQKRRPKASPFEKAVRLLGRRGYAVQEIHQALINKGYFNDEVTETIKKLVEYNYLDDAKFAYERIRSRATLSKWGKKRIQTELKNKGVAEHIANQAFENFEGGDEERMGEAHNWQQQAIDLLQRKYGAWPEELETSLSKASNWEEKQQALKEINKEKAKRINFLLRRGFTQEQSIKAFEFSRII